MSIGVGNDRYIVDEIHCKFLSKADDGKYTCTVYERRFELAPWCLKAADAARDGHVAQDCPYGIQIQGFRGKQWASREMREKLMPIIRQKLIEEGLPLSQSPDAALRVLTADGESWTYSEEADRYVFHR
jgi:hypothetical protein